MPRESASGIPARVMAIARPWSWGGARRRAQPTTGSASVSSVMNAAMNSVGSGARGSLPALASGAGASVVSVVVVRGDSVGDVGMGVIPEPSDQCDRRVGWSRGRVSYGSGRLGAPCSLTPLSACRRGPGRGHRPRTGWPRSVRDGRGSGAAVSGPDAGACPAGARVRGGRRRREGGLPQAPCMVRAAHSHRMPLTWPRSEPITYRTRRPCTRRAGALQPRGRQPGARRACRGITTA